MIITYFYGALNSCRIFTVKSALPLPVQELRSLKGEAESPLIQDVTAVRQRAVLPALDHGDIDRKSAGGRIEAENGLQGSRDIGVSGQLPAAEPPSVGSMRPLPM